jgi:hypothetical protein
VSLSITQIRIHARKQTTAAGATPPLEGLLLAALNDGRMGPELSCMSKFVDIQGRCNAAITLR